jgi:hypothetical protein
MATGLKEYTMLDNAVGTIEAGEAQQERLEDVCERVSSGEFHKPITGKIPKVCIDGRPGGDMGPNSAGGTFTLTVADDLTTQRFSAGKTLAEADREISQVVIGEGEEVGGHCDDHPNDVNCGCGAKDRIKPIYGCIVEHQQTIRDQVTALGIEVSDETHNLIVSRAQERTEFSTGAELSAALKDVAGPQAESALHGAHKEVIAIVNTREGTSLDREALAAIFGNNYQAFNIDTWSFLEAAKAISLTDEEVAQKVVAMAYYNFAAADILCGRKMRVASLA